MLYAAVRRAPGVAPVPPPAPMRRRPSVRHSARVFSTLISCMSAAPLPLGRVLLGLDVQPERARLFHESEPDARLVPRQWVHHIPFPMRSVGEVVREEAREGRRLPLGVEDVARDDDVRVAAPARTAAGQPPRAKSTCAADASGGATELFVRSKRETHRRGVNVAEENAPGAGVRRSDSGDAETRS